MENAEPEDVMLDITADDDSQPNDTKDPAAEAFARLQGELALMRRAVQHLAAEKADIAIPDYGATLTEMVKQLGSIDFSLHEIADHPAMQLTPDSVGKRIEAAAEHARRSDGERINHACKGLYEAASELRIASASARTAEQQKTRLFQAAGGGVIAGILLWSFLPGTIARSMPERWHWAERMAARMVGASSPWDAGARLMRIGDAQAWNVLIQAADIRRDNRDAIDACRNSAATSRQPVRCTIKINSLR